MTCVELRESLTENENASNAVQRAHLRDCPDCAALVADLLVIACAAGDLRAADEPDPRVWKNIETALRREKLIRPQTAGRSLLPSFSNPWDFSRWLVPAAAVLLVAIGIYVRPHSNPQSTTEIARTSVPFTANAADVQLAGLNDDDLLQEVSQQSPALAEQYSDSLRRVNQSIQEAKEVVAAYPDDDEARRSLMDAYQQKAMLFELALDRSLP